MRAIIPLIYVIIGVVVAQQHNFLEHLTSVSRIISAVLAIALWPLVLLGVNLHVKLG